MNNALRNQIRQTAQQRLNDVLHDAGPEIANRLAALVQAYSTPGEVKVRIVEPRVVEHRPDPDERTGRIVHVSKDGAIRVQHDNGEQCGGLSVEDVEVVDD